MTSIDDLMKQIEAKPGAASLLATILQNPRRGIETLDLLIRSPGISEESRKNYQGVRAALEDYFVETLKTPVMKDTQAGDK